jgi:hypothetical protein
MVLLSVIFFPHAMPVLAHKGSTQVIEVTAKKYEYSPAPIHVKSGAKIQLKITATDHLDIRIWSRERQIRFAQAIQEMNRLVFCALTWILLLTNSTYSVE